MSEVTPPPRSHLIRRHLPGRALVVAGMLVALLPGAAFARKPLPNPTPTGTATCAVTPNPVALGAEYFINGSGYAPNEVLQEWISGYNLTILFSGADAYGNLSGASAWANHTGSYTVTVKDGNTGTALASCAFSIQ